MDPVQQYRHRSVEEILIEWPQVSKVFQAFKTACVGCYLSRFCTLEEAAAAYNLELDPFLAKMAEATHLQTEGAINESH